MSSDKCFTATSARKHALGTITTTRGDQGDGAKPMGSKLSSKRLENVGEAPPGFAIKKKAELIVVDTLLEEGLNDGDLPHLCLDRTLLLSSGHDAFGSRDLGDVLATIRKTKRIKLNKLSVMFNGTGGGGIGDFVAKDSTIREVTVLCEKLSEESVQSLAGALEINRTVNKLLLGGQELQEDAAAALGKALKSSSSLQQLTLFNCGFRDVGAEVIAFGLAANNTLERLDMTYCGIGDEGAAGISRAVRLHPTLSHLNLRNNAVGPKGSTSLADALRGNSIVRELILGANCAGNGGASALADALSVNTTLAYLDLGSNGIGDEGGLAIADGLAQNTCLKFLNLRANSVGHETCERVRIGWNKRNAKRSMQLGQPWHDGLSLPF